MVRLVRGARHDIRRASASAMGVDLEYLSPGGCQDALVSWIWGHWNESGLPFAEAVTFMKLKSFPVSLAPKSNHVTYTHLKAKETSFSGKGESVAERSCDFRGHRAEDLVGSWCDHGLYLSLIHI